MVTNVTARNNVRVFGNGTQPMLFAHGFGCDQNMWRFITKEFEDDYRIVLFDYVGSGKSDSSSYDAARWMPANRGQPKERGSVSRSAGIWREVWGEICVREARSERAALFSSICRGIRTRGARSRIAR